MRTTRVEPAINDILDAMHRATAFLAREDNVVYIRTVEFNIIWHIRPEFLQFGDTADTVRMSAVVTHPDRQGSAPIAFTTQSPVDIVFQPVAETSVFDMLWIPVDLLIVLMHLIPDGGRLDEPRFTGIVEQGVITPPTERILVRILGSLK